MRFTPALSTLLLAPLAAALTVPVNFNVLYDENNPNDGNVSDSTVSKQIDMINYFTGRINLNFQISNLQRIPVSKEKLNGWGRDTHIYDDLRRGDAKTLNIYTAGQSKDGDALLASFPWDYQNSPQHDGIMIDYNYLPGGKRTGYNTGKVLVQGVGLWSGLRHTYEGGCVNGGNGGDYVDDTPAEYTPAEGCPRGRDSCPGSPGLDPIDNIMDSTNDECRVRLTSGQYNRMARMLNQYRGISLY